MADGRHRFARFALIPLAFVVSRSAGAMASGSLVFDPMNFVRNTMTALNSIRNVEWEIRSSLIQYETLEMEIASLKNLPSATLAALGSVTGVTRTIREYRVFLTALQGTAGSLHAGYHRLLSLNRKLASAHLSWSRYDRLLRQGVTRHEAEADAQVHEDNAILRSITHSYARLRVVESTLPVAKSMKGQLESLNASLGVVARADTGELAVLTALERARASARSESLAASTGWMRRHRLLDRRVRSLTSHLATQNAGPGLRGWLDRENASLKPVIPDPPRLNVPHRPS
jgi:conjugal transfer/entry exclusion protein